MMATSSGALAGDRLGGRVAFRVVPGDPFRTSGGANAITPGEHASQLGPLLRSQLGRGGADDVAQASSPVLTAEPLDDFGGLAYLDGAGET
jgi:hypothetical protein